MCRPCWVHLESRGCGTGSFSKESTADSAVWFAGTIGTRCAKPLGHFAIAPPSLDSNNHSSPASADGSGSSTRPSQTASVAAASRPLTTATLRPMRISVVVVRVARACQPPASRLILANGHLSSEVDAADFGKTYQQPTQSVQKSR